ncbi:MAG: hypothetical protein R2712_07535 [Vicinamibacterales bacterium]
MAGPSGGVSAGRMTTAAAFATLLEGGNAFDAGVTALLVGGVVGGGICSAGSVAGAGAGVLTGERTVTSVVGEGWAPKAWTWTGSSRAARRWRARASTPAWSCPVPCAGAHRAREVGHHELRAGGRAGHHRPPTRVSSAPAPFHR